MNNNKPILIKNCGGIIREMSQLEKIKTLKEEYERRTRNLAISMDAIEDKTDIGYTFYQERRATLLDVITDLEELLKK